MQMVVTVLLLVIVFVPSAGNGRGMVYIVERALIVEMLLMVVLDVVGPR